MNPNIIIGFKEGGDSTVQAYHYPVAEWTEARARAHCREKGGRFEAAVNRSIRAAAGQGD